jgi:hypothetical protein
MNQVVLLDSGIVGLVSSPRRSTVAQACLAWLDQLTAFDAGNIVRVPAIADYEVRRELIRARRMKGLARLDEVVRILGYLPISESGLHVAAALWAEARSRGYPTAADAALDGDVILAAQAREAETEFDSPVVVATTNVAHLSRYVDARRWQDIPTSPSAR